MITDIILKDLFHAKIFYGGFRPFWNPIMSPYVSGLRKGTFAMDIIQSNLRVRKLLLFILRAASKYVDVAAILQPALKNLSKRIYPFLFYAPFWKGGVISNYSSTFNFYKKINADYFMPRFPGIALLFAETNQRMAAAVVECVATRTPSAFFGDAGSYIVPATFGIPGTNDVGSAIWLSTIALNTVKKGKRLASLSFTKFIKFSLIKYIQEKSIIAEKHTHIPVYTALLNRYANYTYLLKDVKNITEKESGFKFDFSQSEILIKLKNKVNIVNLFTKFFLVARKYELTTKKYEIIPKSSRYDFREVFTTVEQSTKITCLKSAISQWKSKVTEIAKTKNIKRKQKLITPFMLKWTMAQKLGYNPNFCNKIKAKNSKKRIGRIKTRLLFPIETLANAQNSVNIVRKFKRFQNMFNFSKFPVPVNWSL